MLYSIERFLLGGTHYRLLFIAALLGAISVAGGMIVYRYDARHAGLSSEVWWAFLRLSDPGYLGDDQGLVRRIVSTVITILGYVLFLGALVAVMTQWLNGAIRQLERGLTPIARRNHIVILGWTSRTPEILRELLASTDRVKRFLRRLGTRSLEIAVLAPDVDLDLVAELRERLGSRYGRTEVILRSGSPLQLDHLRRVDYGRAAVIILPGDDQGTAVDEASADARTVKTMLTIRQFAALDGDTLPTIVAAVNNPRVADFAEEAYRGGRVHIVATEDMVGRMMAQNLRHPGLSYVLNDILSHDDGSEIYIQTPDGVVGRTIGSLLHHYSDGIILGLLRGADAPMLNPPLLEVIRADDRLIMLSEEYELALQKAPREGPAAASRPSPPDHAELRRVLILGWNHTVPAVLRELDRHPKERIVVDLISTVAVKKREKRLQQEGFLDQRISISHQEGDYTIPGDLDAFSMANYHNILIVGSDRLETAEDADARTLLGHHLVRERINGVASRPHVLVELRDPTNADLFDNADTEVLATGELLSHVIAQIALRGDLRAVFDLLWAPEGPEIIFRPLAGYGLGERFAFSDLLDAVARSGETALGLRQHDTTGRRGGIVLNPPRAQVFAAKDCGAVVVLTTVESTQDLAPQ